MACCSPWGRNESDTTERLNSTTLLWPFYATNPPCWLFIWGLLSSTSRGSHPCSLFSLTPWRRADSPALTPRSREVYFNVSNQLNNLKKKQPSSQRSDSDHPSPRRGNWETPAFIPKQRLWNTRLNPMKLLFYFRPKIIQTLTTNRIETWLLVRMSTGRPFCRQHKTNPVWSAGTFAVVAGSPRQLADLLSKRSAGI